MAVLTMALEIATVIYIGGALVKACRKLYEHIKKIIKKEDSKE